VLEVFEHHKLLSNKITSQKNDFHSGASYSASLGLSGMSVMWNAVQETRFPGSLTL